MVEQKKIPLTFITGNKKKLEEFTKIMEGCLDQYEVTNKSLDLDELQDYKLSLRYLLHLGLHYY